jgi:hypothetical protein
MESSSLRPGHLDVTLQPGVTLVLLTLETAIAYMNEAVTIGMGYIGYICYILLTLFSISTSSHLIHAILSMSISDQEDDHCSAAQAGSHSSQLDQESTEEISSPW